VLPSPSLYSTKSYIGFVAVLYISSLHFVCCEYQNTECGESACVLNRAMLYLPRLGKHLVSRRSVHGLTLHLTGGTAWLLGRRPQHKQSRADAPPTATIRALTSAHPIFNTLLYLFHSLFLDFDTLHHSPCLTQDHYRTHRLTHHSRARHSRNGSLNTRSTRPPCTTFIRRPASIRRRNYTKPPTKRPNNAIVDQRRRCA
jgi:hypothetical protein